MAPIKHLMLLANKKVLRLARLMPVRSFDSGRKVLACVCVRVYVKVCVCVFVCLSFKGDFRMPLYI